MSRIGGGYRAGWTVINDDDLVVVSVVAIAAIVAAAAAASAVGGTMLDHTRICGSQGVSQNGATNGTSNKTRA